MDYLLKNVLLLNSEMVTVIWKNKKGPQCRRSRPYKTPSKSPRGEIVFSWASSHDERKCNLKYQYVKDAEFFAESNNVTSIQVWVVRSIFLYTGKIPLRTVGIESFSRGTYLQCFGRHKGLQIFTGFSRFYAM